VHLPLILPPFGHATILWPSFSRRAGCLSWKNTFALCSASLGPVAALLRRRFMSFADFAGQRLPIEAWTELEAAASTFAASPNQRYFSPLRCR